ncbi:cache domain-containing sensor histidine kinase [Paenibacillus pinistramenti]|uniref:cache domain-containing sensor histidine kinase n=1 Tax=Paenibacillus pinistramenti TaxID=1768003 RepID=UPI0011086572|nr:sensor histidine kinase [Paenibacillus pinistramenti]
MIFWNIKTKLFLVLITLSILPIVIVTYNSYHNYTRLVNQQTSLIASDTIDHSVNSISTILNNIDRISLTIQQQNSSPTAYSTVSDELKKLARTSDPYEMFVIHNKLKVIMENLLLSYNYVNGIYLFSPDGKYISYGNTSDLQVDYVPFNDDWYKKTLKSGGQLYIGEPGVKPYIINSKKSISFSRALYDLNTQEFLGVFMIDCSMNIFNELVSNAVPSKDHLYLVDDTDDIIYDSTNNLSGEELPDELRKNADLNSLAGDQQMQFYNNGNLVVVQQLPNFNWKIVASISLSDVYQKYGISKKLILYISVTCAVILLLLSIVLSNWITKPIIRLVKIMRKNKSQKFRETGLPQKRMDEIGILYTEYDKMIQDMDNFVRENYQNKILAMDAQMKALEAQINSHFLFNTLESINSIAEIEEVESITIMTKALGDMFRYSIKTDSELVLTKEELKHVENYLTIQTIRYSEKIKFEIEIEEEVLKSRILKLILQPLVENSIYHGLEGMKDGGIIQIKGYKDKVTQFLCFEVTDNGVGIPEKELHKIKESLMQPHEFTKLGHRSKQSIGIKNVHSRISLYYGEGFGLEIDSCFSSGTRIKITLPGGPGGNNLV